MTFRHHPLAQTTLVVGRIKGYLQMWQFISKDRWALKHNQIWVLHGIHKRNANNFSNKEIQTWKHSSIGTRDKRSMHDAIENVPPHKRNQGVCSVYFLITNEFETNIRFVNKYFKIQRFHMTTFQDVLLQLAIIDLKDANSIYNAACSTLPR